MTDPTNPTKSAPVKNKAAQELARGRFAKMTPEERKEWGDHMRAISKKKRTRKPRLTE